jgi:hypothetical protein
MGPCEVPRPKTILATLQYNIEGIRATFALQGVLHTYENHVVAIDDGLSIPVCSRQADQSASAADVVLVSSVGVGKGANLGGIEGGDRQCQSLAAAAGAGNRTWHAYLSTNAADGKPAVNARDRIGQGPWFNAKGGRIAQNLSDLHGDTLDQARVGNTLTKATALTEKGDTVKGFGDTPNQHDILTGSQPDGRAYTDGMDHTCKNWTSDSDGTAQLGHFDRTGGPNTSWNSAHPSRGCSQDNLVSTGGAGLLYCFAVN